MKQLSLILGLVLVCVQLVFAQERSITGTVTDAETGEPLIGANVTVKGTSAGAVTDVEGQYRILASEGAMLVFTYTGYTTQEIALGASNTLNVQMIEGITVEGVVVTALGIKREQRSLGYATQEVGGEEVSTVKDANFMNSLSGKVAGVSVKPSGTLGGSSNVIIRGYKSLTGNNQALFVVDGIPISNDVNNTTDQKTGRGGYDFGNAAMDINPEDIETISVLKGAAATALYGSRAANGVVLITTKRGTKRKGLGVTVSSGVTFGNIDQTTMPRYQKQYGQGYGAFYGSTDGYFNLADVDGDGADDLVVPMEEDASYGGAYDPNLQVYTWESVFPELSTYKQKMPYVASDNDATNSFYETATTFNNSFAVDGGNDAGSFRLGYTNYKQNGVVPGSELNRNNFSFSGSYKLTEKLTASSTVNIINNEITGLYGTGYDSRNPNQSFRQWYSTGADFNKLREAYESTGKNISWNTFGWAYPNPTQAHYFDNPFFAVHENFGSSERARTIGNIELNYKFNDWLNFLGRVSMDRYDELQEERIAVGSVDVPAYKRYNRSFVETNTDLILSANKYFGADDIININGNLGANFRRSHVEAVRAETNGGLVVPEVYSLSNSVNAIVAPTETSYSVGVNGFFGRVSFGYDRFLYLDLTGRYDISSTLPEDNNTYFYPAASLSFVFSELVQNDLLSFGKLRLNYAEVGNDAPAQSIYDAYLLNTPFSGVALASAPATQNNPDLVAENTKSYEAGLDVKMLNNRVGFDLSVYKSNTFNQILPVTVSGSTGKTSKYVNAGNIENRGVELVLFGTALQSNGFSWDISLNWSKNQNEVVELFEDQDNLLLASVQGGITINATKGEAYGAIKGTNFVYHENGEKIVYAYTGTRDGMRYRKTTTPEVIGNITPDWRGGIRNTFRYKDLAASFLIDIQKGGDFFSLDTWYGYATGIYDITAGTNDKGNPVRDRVTNGGGISIGGVLDDGTPNTTYGWMGDYANAIGYSTAPNALHIYDASFVKLREVALSYRLPRSLVSKTPFQGLEIGATGRNLWIIHKNTEYSDPEAGLSAGNFQGNQSGAYPVVKEVGVNIKLKF